MELTAYQKVTDALLRTRGTTLEIVLLDAQDAGQSFQATTRQLRDLTDGAVEVTPEAVRKWTQAAQEVAA